MVHLSVNDRAVHLAVRNAILPEEGRLALVQNHVARLDGHRASPRAEPTRVASCSQTINEDGGVVAKSYWTA